MVCDLSSTRSSFCQTFFGLFCNDGRLLVAAKLNIATLLSYTSNKSWEEDTPFLLVLAALCVQDRTEAHNFFEGKNYGEDAKTMGKIPTTLHFIGILSVTRSYYKPIN